MPAIIKSESQVLWFDESGRDGGGGIDWEVHAFSPHPERGGRTTVGVRFPTHGGPLMTPAQARELGEALIRTADLAEKVG